MHRLLRAVTPIALVGLLAPFIQVPKTVGDVASAAAPTVTDQRPVKIDDGRIAVFARWSVQKSETDSTGFVPDPFLSLPSAPGKIPPRLSASPVSTTGAGSLEMMLDQVPAAAAEPVAGSEATVSYANIAAQLEAIGVQPPSDTDREGLNEWTPAISSLALPPALLQHALNEQWRETFGFDLVQVDQSLFVGLPPDTVMLLRGRFDEAELRAAWAASGYEEIEVNGTVVASLAPTPEVDFDSPAGRLALGSMNNAVLLTDGTLVFAASLESIEAVLAVEAGDAASRGEQPEVADLIAATPEDLATAMVIPGEALRGADVANRILGGLTDEEIDALATEVAAEGDQAETMPAVRLALLGITAGTSIIWSNQEGPPNRGQDDRPEARISIALLMADRAAVERAAPIVLSRLEEGTSIATGEPYAQFYPERRAEPAPEGPVLLVTLQTEDMPARVIFEMYYRRDLGFLAW